jgi:anti-anti-sigma regulatory factor
MARRPAARTRSKTPARDALAPVAVTLPVDLDFPAAGQLREALLAARDAAAVEIDAGVVERISTAGVLVLISFLNARADRTPPATVLRPSGAFVDAFSDLGLFQDLMRMEFRT